MGYDDYVRHLRHALVTVGVPEEDAQQFTAHSLRSGAATAAVHSGLDALSICTIAGVKSMDWLVGLCARIFRIVSALLGLLVYNGLWGVL
jgi:hypothetical protein